ncbi:hypothetical protein BBJ29_000974 [Phytophthora kernoviae]|uniref:Uncharacterized protein n=1 Tax=Phytophthora kernoviae TaxID=325452 RepID=A0A3F2RY15_9STRA|nr:hypothetical protein BBJ29_000974 [Phytophthora kernoviae]RLN66467.1 hypothetical protein BBP00_00002180 [Phytophthora kernoviae]
MRVIRFSLCTALIAAQFQRNYSGADPNTHEDLIRAHGDAIFNVMPRNSVLLSYTDINWNSVRYLQTCEDVRPDVTHLSLQLLPFPWFPRQHALFPTIKFPLIHRGASTTKGSAGYARLLHDFLAANVAQHGNHLFLDLHAVNDEDIAPNGQYLGFTLTPHGLVWRVNMPIANVDALYSQWETVPSPAVHFAVAVYPPGSWEFAAATIANDARYQSGLFALSHWLERGRIARHASEAAEYVLGIHRALQLLIQVEAATVITGGNWGLTYEYYDMAKNTALAAMRVTSGLDLIAPLLPPLKQENRRNGASHKELREIKELEELVRQTDDIRQATHRRIQALVPDMKIRQDRDTKAFEDFVAESLHHNKKTESRSKKGRKKRSRH